MGELPGKLQNIQQLIAHLLPPLKCTIKYQLLPFQNAANSAVKQRLTASIMTESGVLAVKTKPSPLAPLTSAPSSGEDAWYMIWLSSLSGTTVWHTAIIVRNSQI